MLAVADAISIACARTLVAEDKELFLGEQSLSYLAAATTNVSLLTPSLVPFYVVNS